MKRFLFAIVMLIAPALAAADLVARQGDDSLRLTETPCTNELVVALLDGQAEHFRAASARFQGQLFNGCWRMLGNSAYIVYDDGDKGIVPKSELHEALDI